MTFKITGLKEFQQKLEDLERKAEVLHGEHEVPFSELFNSYFMQKYTNFSTLEELIEAGGFKVDSEEDFKAIPDQEWGVHIAKTTKFANWQEMMEKAGAEWAKKQLGL
jgi:hypothetical protein